MNGYQMPNNYGGGTSVEALRQRQLALQQQMAAAYPQPQPPSYGGDSLSQIPLYPSAGGVPPQLPLESEHPDMRMLAQDIEMALPTNQHSIGVSQPVRMPVPETPMMTETAEPEKKEKKTTTVPEWLQEPLLLLTVYLVLSISSVRQGITTHLPQLNPDSSGEVTLTGKVLYGVVLVGSFYLARKVLLS